MSYGEEPFFMRKTAERALPDDPATSADVEAVLRDGYIVLENVFTKEEAEEAKAEMRRLSGDSPMMGRNRFEGLDTTRVYSLLNKTRVFDKFAMLPRVLALNDFFLDPGYQISAFHTIEIRAGEEPQEMHHDDAYCRVPRPRPPLGSAIILAFDEFTEENGATRIVAGSHKWETGRLPTEYEAKTTSCPAGSALYFIGTTWHSGGGNMTDKSRMSATVQYCQPYIRPIENQILAVDPRRLGEIPDRLVQMMGYRTHFPFIGYADGLNPLRAAKRMVRWLQNPLDRNPPGFTAESKL